MLLVSFSPSTGEWVWLFAVIADAVDILLAGLTLELNAVADIVLFCINWYNLFLYSSTVNCISSLNCGTTS